MNMKVSISWQFWDNQFTCLWSWSYYHLVSATTLYWFVWSNM